VTCYRSAPFSFIVVVLALLPLSLRGGGLFLAVLRTQAVVLLHRMTAISCSSAEMVFTLSEIIIDSCEQRD
jgi:hypothetical protein